MAKRNIPQPRKQPPKPKVPEGIASVPAPTAAPPIYAKREDHTADAPQSPPDIDLEAPDGGASPTEPSDMADQTPKAPGIAPAPSLGEIVASPYSPVLDEMDGLESPEAPDPFADLPAPVPLKVRKSAPPPVSDNAPVTSSGSGELDSGLRVYAFDGPNGEPELIAGDPPSETDPPPTPAPQEASPFNQKGNTGQSLNQAQSEADAFTALPRQDIPGSEDELNRPGEQGDNGFTGNQAEQVLKDILEELKLMQTELAQLPANIAAELTAG